MKRFMLASMLAILACPVTGAQPAATAPRQEPYGMASYLAAFAATGPEDFQIPEPTEASLVPGSGSGNPALIRGFSLAGMAGGIVMTVWGLGDVARTVVDGGDAARVHQALALALSGTVLAAISSTISGLAGK
jgi:hypothetical protein